MFTQICFFQPLSHRFQLLDQHSLITVLNQLVPVRARRQIIYPTDKLGINAPSDRIMKSPQPYALYHINRKLALEPKVRTKFTQRREFFRKDFTLQRISF